MTIGRSNNESIKIIIKSSIHDWYDGCTLCRPYTPLGAQSHHLQESSTSLDLGPTAKQRPAKKTSLQKLCKFLCSTSEDPPLQQRWLGRFPFSARAFWPVSDMLQDFPLLVASAEGQKWVREGRATNITIITRVYVNYNFSSLISLLPCWGPLTDTGPGEGISRKRGLNLLFK